MKCFSWTSCCCFFRYYHTGRLTESSDVFSFGVVLLEVATGEPPIVPGHGHIIRRVKQKIATGDIGSIADLRLGSAYDISSMWKVIDTAVMCTADSAAQRPTMATVVIQLKESLALEETREKDSSIRVSRGSDIEAMVSTFRPLARWSCAWTWIRFMVDASVLKVYNGFLVNSLSCEDTLVYNCVLFWICNCLCV